MTLFIYGLSMFIQKGMVAFPFPLNEFVFFGVTVYFSFFHFMSDKISYLLMLLIATVSLFSSQMFWSFFLDNEGMYALSESVFTDVMRISFQLLTLAGITRFYYLTAWKVSLLAYPVIICGYAAGAALNLPFLQGAAMLLFTGILTWNYRKNENAMVPYSKSLYYLWCLMTFLCVTMLLTIYLNDTVL